MSEINKYTLEFLVHQVFVFAVISSMYKNIKLLYIQLFTVDFFNLNKRVCSNSERDDFSCNNPKSLKMEMKFCSSGAYQKTFANQTWIAGKRKISQF